MRTVGISLLIPLMLMVSTTASLFGQVSTAEGQQSANMASDGLPKGFESLLISATISKPDRSEVEMANGAKLPYTTTPDREFLVLGKLRVNGDWKLPKGVVPDQLVSLRLVLTAKPVLNIRDPKVNGKFKTDGQINWAEWEVDFAQNKPGDAPGSSEDGPRQGLVPNEKPNGPDVYAEKANVGDNEQQMELVVELKIPDKEGKVDFELPFELLWKPKQDWKPDWYYSITVKQPKNVRTIRAGVFQVTRPDVDWERESRVFTYRLFRRFGFNPDPFQWLRHE